jgi:hypothetical protein
MVLFRFNQKAWVALAVLASSSGLLAEADNPSGIRGIQNDSNTRGLAKDQVELYSLGKHEIGCTGDVQCQVCNKPAVVFFSLFFLARFLPRRFSPAGTSVQATAWKGSDDDVRGTRAG